MQHLDGMVALVQPNTSHVLALPAVMQCGLRAGCPLPLVCSELRSAAREELRRPELAAVWALAARPIIPLATIMRDAWAAGRSDAGLELARVSGARQQQLALIDFAGAGDLNMCKVLVTVSGAQRHQVMLGAVCAAAAHGHIQVCKLLLSNGALTGDGALYAAKRARNADMCRLLMLHDLDKFVGTPLWDGCAYALILRDVVNWSDDGTVLEAADEVYP